MRGPLSPVIGNQKVDPIRTSTPTPTPTPPRRPPRSIWGPRPTRLQVIQLAILLRVILRQRSDACRLASCNGAGADQAVRDSTGARARRRWRSSSSRQRRRAFGPPAVSSDGAVIVVSSRSAVVRFDRVAGRVFATPAFVPPFENPAERGHGRCSSTPTSTCRVTGRRSSSRWPRSRRPGGLSVYRVDRDEDAEPGRVDSVSVVAAVGTPAQRVGSGTIVAYSAVPATVDANPALVDGHDSSRPRASPVPSGREVVRPSATTATMSCTSSTTRSSSLRGSAQDRVHFPDRHVGLDGPTCRCRHGHRPIREHRRVHSASIDGVETDIASARSPPSAGFDSGTYSSVPAT